MNKKLFKKLNEQIEVNNILSEEATTEEIQKIENKVIFENINITRIQDLSINPEE